MNISNYNFFHEHGYIIVDAINAQDLNAFQASLSNTISIYLKKNSLPQLTPAKQFNFKEQCDYGLSILRSINPDYSLAIQAVISRTPEFYKLCSNKIIMNTARNLLTLAKNSSLYLTNNGIIFTNPNDSNNHRSCNIELDWHKDTFFTIPKSRFVQIWVPLLHDASPEIGTLQVCPGSHLAGIGKQKMHMSVQYDHRFTMDKQEISQYVPQELQVRLGQALIFDGRLIHRSGKNISTHIRSTMLFSLRGLEFHSQL